MAEALPQVTYLTPDGRELTVSDLVVVGTVSAVAHGIGGKDVDGAWVETEFDDPAAIVRTYELTITIERVVGGEYAGEEVAIGLALGDAVTPEVALAGLRDLGRLVVFLTADSPVFAYEPRLYAVLEDGGLTGLVAADGSLSLPVVTDERESRLLAGALTLEELVHAGSQPATAQLVEVGGTLVRR